MTKRSTHWKALLQNVPQMAFRNTNTEVETGQIINDVAELKLIIVPSLAFTFSSKYLPYHQEEIFHAVIQPIVAREGTDEP